MKVLMIENLELTDGINEWILKSRKHYEIPDYWARQLVSQGYGAEYIIVRGLSK